VLHPAKKTIDFVPLPTLDIEKQKNLKLQLSFPDDTQLCLSGDISEVLLSTLLREIRTLAYDGSGFWLMTKRLSKGKFTFWPKSTSTVSRLNAIKLQHILVGNDPSQFQRIG